jgi:hypothetical protein
LKAALAVAAALVAACSLAGTACADGDPASDYLLGIQVFIPYDLKLPAAKQKELTALVHLANSSGFKIRVAVIGSAYDLGAVAVLWRKPRPYAKFLGAELQFVYKQRLLVVMPNGFGFNWPKHPSTAEYAVLSKLAVKPGAVGLLDSAEQAVRKLAAASGVKLAANPPAAKQGSGGFAHSRALIVLAALAGVAILILLRLALRSKSP